MSAPAARLLAALELLQARRRVTGAELAERLDVDRRSVRRYVARLLDMGVPIVAERGRDGAYRLTAGYKLPPMMFSDDEALALAMGLVAARGLGLGQARIAVDSALAKLERVMPDALRLRVRSVGRAVQLDLRPAGAAAHERALAVLSEALHRQQRVRLRYQAAESDLRAAEITERDVDPWGLAFYQGHWYTVGHCHLRQAQRSFRLDRILSVTPLPASFAPPPDFDTLAALRRTMAALPRRHAFEVELLATLAQAQHHLDPEAGTLEPLPGDPPRVRYTGRADDLDWMARDLARLPMRLRVIAPAALAMAVRAHAEQRLADNR